MLLLTVGFFLSFQTGGHVDFSLVWEGLPSPAFPKEFPPSFQRLHAIFLITTGNGFFPFVSHGFELVFVYSFLPRCCLPLLWIVIKGVSLSPSSVGAFMRMVFPPLFTIEGLERPLVNQFFLPK